MRVDILGTEYHLIDDPTLLSEGYDGLCQGFKPIIKVRPKHELLDANADDLDREIAYHQILRHEIVHAFFKESGMDRWFDDEDLVQYLAVMIPKMQRVFLQVGCNA